MFNNQQSAHLLCQENQGNKHFFYQELSQYVYPPLYLQGPGGLYYVSVPLPESYLTEHPGSTGDLSESEGSDDGESLPDMSEDLGNYDFSNIHEMIDDMSEDFSEEEYSTPNDEDLTNIVLSIKNE